MVCKGDLELLLQIMWEDQALAWQRGGGSGVGNGGSPLKIGNKARDRDQVHTACGIAEVRENPCWFESKDFLTNGVWMHEG